MSIVLPDTILKTMTAAELIDRWSEEIIFRFDREKLIKLGVDSQTTDLLANIGLPEDAAPFLIFGGIHNVSTIAHIYKTTDADHQLLVEIGIDGGGDPICIDIKNNCEIVMCDHENGFQKRYMNSSASQLLHFITLYKDFAETLIKEKGEYAFIEADFSDEQFEQLIQQLTRVDSKALAAATYWDDELQNLKANRAYYQ